MSVGRSPRACHCEPECPKAEGERPKAEGERPKAEGERPKAEGERPKAEGERPKAEGDCPFSLSIYLSLSAATPLSFVPRVQTGQSGRVTSFD